MTRLTTTPTLGRAADYRQLRAHPLRQTESAAHDFFGDLGIPHRIEEAGAYGAPEDEEDMPPRSRHYAVLFPACLGEAWDGSIPERRTKPDRAAKIAVWRRAVERHRATGCQECQECQR